MSAKLDQMREAALALARALPAAQRRERLEAAAWERAIAYGPGGRHTEGGTRYLNVPGMGSARVLSEVSETVLRRLVGIQDDEEVWWVARPDLMLMRGKRGKVTLYKEAAMGFGWRKMEASAFFYQVRPYAQHPVVLEVVFVRKGARLKSTFIESTRPSVVILKGWGHPDLTGDTFTPPELRGGMVVTETRHPAFSEEWVREFGTALDAHVKKTGAQVLLDVRE